MNRPNPLAYVVGHPVVVGASLLFLAACIYQTFTGDWEAMTVLIALVFVVATGVPYHRVRRYKLWRLEWDSMGPPQPKWSLWFGRAKPNPILAVIGGAVLAALTICYFLDSGDLDTHTGGMLLFSTTTIAVGLALHFHRRRTMPARSRRKKPREHYVAVTLGKPSRAPTPMDAHAALPDYCRRLMQ